MDMGGVCLQHIHMIPSVHVKQTLVAVLTRYAHAHTGATTEQKLGFCVSHSSLGLVFMATALGLLQTAVWILLVETHK